MKTLNQTATIQVGYDSLLITHRMCLECSSSNPCENDGRCISLGLKENPYTCICKDGFVGSRCQFKNIVKTCGRSAYSASHDPAPIPNLFLNEYLNTDFLNR